MSKLVIGGALAATLLACYFAPSDDGDIIAPANARAQLAEPAHEQAPPLVAGAVLPALDIHPRMDDDEMGNAFAKQSWLAATPVQAGAGAAQPAVSRTIKPSTVASHGAPALPIRFLGRFIDDGQAAYFLQVAERNVVAHVGEKVDDNYTFDSATGDTLTFTYLPLHQQQVLVAGDTN
jgi:hypothetical protein